MKRTCKLVSILLSLMLLVSAAAETVSFDGSVKTLGSTPVNAPIGGTAGTVVWLEGQKIAAGETIVTLAPDTAKAPVSGTVTGIFASEGDDLDSITARYGAVLYIDPDACFTVTTNTDKAYDAAENKYIRIGESVYLQGVNYTNHVGTGRVTNVSGTNYTVSVNAGADFYPGESVRIFREASYSSKSRIGTGNISRVDPAAVSVSGSLFSLLVKDGDHVDAGDKLFTYLGGTFDGLYMSGNTVTSPVSGIIETVNVAAGDTVQKNACVMNIVEPDSLYIEFTVSESDLMYIAEGDKVKIEFMWNEGMTEMTDGTITFISFLSVSGTDGAGYTVHVDFEPTDETRIGMTAVVYTVEEESED